MTSFLMRTLALSLLLASPTMAAAVIGCRIGMLAGGLRTDVGRERWAYGGIACPGMALFRTLLSIEPASDAALASEIAERSEPGTVISEPLFQGNKRRVGAARSAARTRPRAP
ncbi:hypothetical protein [Xanthomonas arboricola]|nr:hypothetical protein [Xanthomonas arboricola]